MPPIRGTNKMFKNSESNSTLVDAGTGGRASTPALPGGKPEPALIGPSIRIKGEISGDEDLIVCGQVEGSIDLGEGLLVVAKDGQVDAEVSARVITVEGRVKGDLRAQEQIIVRRSGRVNGSIAAPRIALDFGCAFSGSIETDRTADCAVTDSDNKVADIKTAISSTGAAHAKAVAGEPSPR